VYRPDVRANENKLQGLSLNQAQSPPECGLLEATRGIHGRQADAESRSVGGSFARYRIVDPHPL